MWAKWFFKYSRCRCRFNNSQSFTKKYSQKKPFNPPRFAIMTFIFSSQLRNSSAKMSPSSVAELIQKCHRPIICPTSYYKIFSPLVVCVGFRILCITFFFRPSDVVKCAFGKALFLNEGWLLKIALTAYFASVICY